MPEKPEAADVAALDELVSAVAGMGLTAGIADPPRLFFADLRRMISASRLYGVTQLLHAGTGATVAAAATRGVLESALISRWESTHDNADAALATLAQERIRIVTLVEQEGLIVPNWERWLAPVSGTEALRPLGELGWPDAVKLVSKRPSVTAGILGMSSAMADLLSAAGHANAAATRMTVGQAPHAVGFEPAPIYRAVIAQAVGRATVFTLDLPHDHPVWAKVEQLTTVTRAVTLLPATDAPGPLVDKGVTKPVFTGEIEFLPTTPMVEAAFANLLDDVSKFAELLRHGPNPYDGPSNEVNLSAALPYLTALGTAEVCFAAATGDLPADLAAVAARMLLEEGARTQWMFGHGDEAEVTARYRAVLNAETKTRSQLRTRLASHAVPQATIASLLDALPKDQVPDLDTIRTIPAGRTTIEVPPSEQMLQLGVGYAEPGWLSAAYSLLSQVTHMTPLGLLHSVGRSVGGSVTLSHEMTALAVDAAALGVTRTIGPHAAILANHTGAGPIDDWLGTLWRAARQIHQTAQLLHFLD